MIEVSMQIKLVAAALVTVLFVGVSVLGIITKSRLTKERAKVAQLELEIEASKYALAAEREAYGQAMELVKTVRESEKRLVGLSEAISLGLDNLGEGHEEIDPCFYAIPDTITIDGLYPFSKDSAP